LGDRWSGKSLVAVATITWARSASEEGLLRRALARLSHAGLPIAVSDTGKSRSFAKFLTTHPEFAVSIESRGLVAQVEATLRLAARFDTPFVLYTEPDKTRFFERLNDFVEQAIDRREPALVLASRSNKSFRTYPPVQRYTEGVINDLCGETVEAGGDFSYGPFLFPRTLLRHLLPLPGEIGWGWRHYAFRQAHRRGLHIHHVVDDYPCPRDQRGEDDGERAHRLRQLSQNILGLLA